jgi:hypothetical protein
VLAFGPVTVVTAATAVLASTGGGSYRSSSSHVPIIIGIGFLATLFLRTSTTFSLWATMTTVAALAG